MWMQIGLPLTSRQFNLDGLNYQERSMVSKTPYFTAEGQNREVPEAHLSRKRRVQGILARRVFANSRGSEFFNTIVRLC